MSEKLDKSTIKDTAEVVKGIIETVPVYQDAFQPAAKEIGAALQTVAKSIHVALLPLRLLVWGYERIEQYLVSSLAEKLKDVPESRIVTPNPAVAGPALEALRFVGNDSVIRELYAELLATAMDSKTASSAHPSFVEIIKQINPDEARLLDYLSSKESAPLVDVVAGSKGKGFFTWLRNFSDIGDRANCSHPENIGMYIDNLCRLGLVEIPDSYKFRVKSYYTGTESHSRVKHVIEVIESHPGRHASIRRKALFLTDFGRQFCNACGKHCEGIRGRVKRNEGKDIWLEVY